MGKKKAIIMIGVGIIGLIITSVLIINNYKEAASSNELLKSIIYNFVPFVISFVLFKLGIKGLTNQNNKK